MLFHLCHVFLNSGSEAENMAPNDWFYLSNPNSKHAYEFLNPPFSNLVFYFTPSTGHLSYQAWNSYHNTSSGKTKKRKGLSLEDQYKKKKHMEVPIRALSLANMN